MSELESLKPLTPTQKMLLELKRQIITSKFEELLSLRQDYLKTIELIAGELGIVDINEWELNQEGTAFVRKEEKNGKKSS